MVNPNFLAPFKQIIKCVTNISTFLPPPPRTIIIKKVYLFSDMGGQSYHSGTRRKQDIMDECFTRVNSVVSHCSPPVILSTLIVFTLFSFFLSFFFLKCFYYVSVDYGMNRWPVMGMRPTFAVSTSTWSHKPSPLMRGSLGITERPPTQKTKIVEWGLGKWT